MRAQTVKPEALVQKLWNYCNILRDDGMSYTDYVEQLTFLLFLKMAEERSKPPFLDLEPLPQGFDWRSLAAKKDEAQLEHYEKILRRLGRRDDLYGVIYKNGLSKFRDPAKFQLLVTEIGGIEWSDFDSDVKGDTYEGLLERTASEGKAGAGQYFTPRALVESIVEVMQPRPGETICDPACGTGGFLLSAHQQIASQRLSPSQKKHLAAETIHGVELVDSVARLCLMNLVLHGIGGMNSPIEIRDALGEKSITLFDVVLANPPFGKKSSVTIVNEAGESSKESLTINRDDFWASTSNKQLNFLQHIFTILKQHGRAAVVLPDNVLFEGGAGETIRRELLKQADVHTLLRLPTGIFYAQGVKANVLFFDRKPAQEKPWTQKLWIYDLRTNLHFTLKENTLKRDDLDDFVACYNPKNRHSRKESERFKSFTYDELSKRDKVNLDIFWLKDDALEESANLPAPEIIAADITADLEAAMEQFATIAEDLKR
jgi:type I restriction enzyme M protein